MKRDMELVRAILLALEARDHFSPSTAIEIEGYEEHEVGYHSLLILEAGLAEGDETTTRGSGPTALLIRPTWEGHEFLDAAREPSVWGQAKDVVRKAGGASLGIWVAVLTDLVKRRVGLA